MVFTNAERRALGYEVAMVLVKQGKTEELAGAAPDETFQEQYDRIGGIVADALEREIAAQPV